MLEMERRNACEVGRTVGVAEGGHVWNVYMFATSMFLGCPYISSLLTTSALFTASGSVMFGTVVFEQESATPSVTPARGPWNENISVTGFSETIGPVNNVSTTQHGQPYLSGLTDFPGEQIPKETNTGYMSSGQDAGAAHLPHSNSRSLQPRRPTAQYRGISNPERAVGFRRPGFTPKPTLTATAATNETRVTSKPTVSTAMHKERRAFFPPRFQERNVDAKLFPPRHTKKMETGSRQVGL